MVQENDNIAVRLKGCRKGFAKADLLARLIARIIDMLIFAALSNLGGIGLIAGFLYLLVADGLMNGRSLGKKIIGLKVVQDPGLDAAGYRDSIIRNAPMALLALFAVIPVIGWVFLLTVGVIIIGISLYLVLTDEMGRRAGDIIARTLVVPSKCQKSEVAEPTKTTPDTSPETKEQEDLQQKGGRHE